VVWWCGVVCFTQGANAALNTIPFVERFGNVAQVDFSLVSAPTFGANYLTLNSKGEFTSQAHPVVHVQPRNGWRVS
jgi:hypothetical protein